MSPLERGHSEENLAYLEIYMEKDAHQGFTENIIYPFILTYILKIFCMDIHEDYTSRTVIDRLIFNIYH